MTAARWPSIVEVYQRWPTKDDCIAHLEAVRWGDTPLCPYCGAERVSHNRDSSRGLTAARWKCQRCLKSFSVTVGTIFHNSHIDLQRWFLLINLMLSAKKGLSAMQAARDLEMRRPTVWSMMHRIRAALADKDAGLLCGIVERYSGADGTSLQAAGAATIRPAAKVSPRKSR